MKVQGRGTGLGLSQVYGFVKQSKGHVRLYSEVGEGTTAKIYLPRLLSEAAIDDAQELLPVPEAATGETILVVEDDFDVRTSTVEPLKELGTSFWKPLTDRPLWRGVEDVGDGARDPVAVGQQPLVGLIGEGSVAVELEFIEDMVGG